MRRQHPDHRMDIPISMQVYHQLIRASTNTGFEKEDWEIAAEAIDEWVRRHDPDAIPPSPASGYQWKRLFLPDGTVLRTVFGGKNYHCLVGNDRIVYDGKDVSPSGFVNAVGGIRRNAWLSTWILFPDTKEWKLADTLRTRQRPRRARNPAISAQPVSSRPATAQPRNSTPATAKPGSSAQAAAAKPGSSTQATAKPGSTKPATTRPSSSTHATAKPGSSAPAATKPGSSTQAATKPVPSAHAATQPGPSRQAAAQPAPATQAAAVRPPVTDARANGATTAHTGPTAANASESPHFQHAIHSHDQVTRTNSVGEDCDRWPRDGFTRSATSRRFCTDRRTKGKERIAALLRQ